MLHDVTKKWTKKKEEKYLWYGSWHKSKETDTELS